MTKFLGSPVFAKSPCPLLVAQKTVFGFMKIQAEFETSVPQLYD